MRDGITIEEGSGKSMKKVALKILNDRLVIDLDRMTEDYTMALGYDGLPSQHDIGELACAKTFAIIELTDSQIETIMAEYENGGECGWCGRIAKELSSPHIFDFAPAEKMCRGCWNVDRETYIGSFGEDIGEFVPMKRGAI